MKKTHTLLAACGIAMAAATSTASFADFSLDKLKAIADKAKAYQEKMKQEPQITSSIPSARAADKVEEAPSSGNLPETSAATPDVMGLTLGVTGLKEAKQAFNKYDPKLKIHEDIVLGGAQPYVGLLRGYAVNCGYLCYRHELKAKLAAPEAGGHVVAAARRLQFTSEDATSLPHMMDALHKKYGEGFYVKQRSQAQMTHLEGFWAWSSDGRLITLSAGHPCADAHAVAPLWANVVNLARAEQYAQPALEAGCSAIIFGSLYAKNDVVTAVNLTAVDVVGIVRSARIAADAQAAASSKQNQIQRGKAGQQRAPTL